MKKRLLFIVPDLVGGGAENQAIQLINGLNSNEYEKHLFTFGHREELLPRLNSEVRYINKKRKNKSDLTVLFYLARFIDQNNIDLVHCTIQISVLIGWCASKLSNRRPPVISCIHNTIPNTQKRHIFNTCIYQWMVRWSEKTIFVCKNQSVYWRSRYPFIGDNFCVVHNGVDTDFFDPDKFMDAGERLRKSLGMDSKTFVFSCIAAFRPEKAHNLLVSVFKKINVQNENAVLLLAGNGPEKNKIEQLVLQMGLEGKVVFLGRIEDVRPLLAATDMMVLPSEAVETFSMAILESLSMATPVITTDIGGSNEMVINGETGFLIQPGDDLLLREAMGTVLNSRKNLSKMGISSRKLIVEKFTLDKMIDKTNKLIQTTLENR